MNCHIATSTKFDFDFFERRASQDKGPRHSLYQVSKFFEAKIHQPDENLVTYIDVVLSKFYSIPQLWALARNVTSQVSDGDIIYCAGEDIGIPLAFWAHFNRCNVKIGTYVMVPNRLRTRVFLKTLRIGRKIDFFTVHGPHTYERLLTLLGQEKTKIFQLPEQVDELFFTPGPGTSRGDFPLIASAGMEQRDYVTLAEATQGKEVEVKICAYSPNLSPKTKVKLPDPVPENMEIRYYEFEELRDLYRSSDIVVISLLKNNYAGWTVLLESLACKRPVIITKNEGLPGDLIDKKLVLGFEAGDVQGLKVAIDTILLNPEEAKIRAEKAYEYFHTYHTSDKYLEYLGQCFR